MKASSMKVIIVSLTIALIQIAFSAKSREGGWDSEQYDEFDLEAGTEQFSDVIERDSLTDLLRTKASLRSVVTECDMDRFTRCVRGVLEAESENTTYTSCRIALNELLEPETYEPYKATKVCRAYMEVNLCAEQTHCDIDAAMRHIERTRTNKYPPDLKHCYEVSRKVCTDIDVAPAPFRNCDNCRNCCNDGGGCFGSDATVLSEDGRQLKMTELSVGDRILTADSENGNYYFDEVLTFLHHEEEDSTLKPLIYLSLANDVEVPLSPYHLVYVATDESALNGLSNQTTSEQTKFAIDLKPGDYVYTVSNSNFEQQFTKVLAVNLKFQRSGYYAPLMASGNVVVDGVLMSCYASSSHSLAHLFMTPLIAYYKISQYLPRLPLDLFDKLGLTTYADKGVHRYAYTLLHTLGALPFMKPLYVH